MSETTGILRYARASVLADYFRSGAGLILTGAPLLAVEASATMTVILGGMALLFAAFGVKTILRQRTQVALDDQGVEMRVLGVRRVDWSDLSGFKLAYYATRRDRTSGWMQLTLDGPAGRLKLDSSLNQFERIVEQGAQVAIERKVTLSAATRANLASMNVILPEAES